MLLLVYVVIADISFRESTTPMHRHFIGDNWLIGVWVQ
jgi:hypothetical protein